jgi:hypothetical protein
MRGVSLRVPSPIRMKPNCPLPLFTMSQIFPVTVVPIIDLGTDGDIIVSRACAGSSSEPLASSVALARPPLPLPPLRLGPRLRGALEGAGRVVSSTSLMLGEVVGGSDVAKISGVDNFLDVMKNMLLFRVGYWAQRKQLN